ncbi:MAG: hypothetical protein AB7H77_01255, partial [Bdellovibrionales bacterium]
GEAEGENRAIRAAEAAISNPLFDDVSMKGARGVLINITGGMDMTLFEVDQAANRIREEVDPEAQIKVGSTLGEDLEGRIRVSVIATGIDANMVNTQRAAGTAGTGHLRIINDPARRFGPITPAVQSTTQQAQPAAPPAQQQQAAPPAPPIQQPPQSQFFSMPPSPPPQQMAPPPPSPPPVQQAQSPQPAIQPPPVQMAPPPPAPPVQQQAAPVYQPAAAPPPPASSPPSSSGQPPIQRYQPDGAAGYAARVAAPAMPAQPPAAAAREPAPSHHPFDMRITQLTTPAQQAAAEQRRTRRSESLFTRITGFGMVRPSEQAEGEEEKPENKENATPQPRLGIDPADRPALSSEPNDLLDIPAFLRRQTNH